MLQLVAAEWERLNKEISPYHELPTFLPTSWITSVIIPAIAIVAVTLTVMYTVFHAIASNVLPKDTTALNKSRICYQATNALFNLAVGILGLYLEYWVLPTLPSYSGSSVDRIVWNHDELYLVSAMQLGYQIWAIPVGILYVKESSEMVMHHTAVVLATSISGFTTAGFRYYTPFFYGVMELSSIPLGIMNSFKDNPDWIKKLPSTYLAIRALFAFSFIWIRVVLCFSRWVPYLKDSFVFMYTAEFGWFKLFLLVQWLLASFLEYLQLFWASMIVKGIVKMFSGSPKKKGKDE
eukprot:Nitzschia sp. Nitz4//scaffold3_size479765//200904//201782//NITZ4_000083-RA/size479765-processed-gene-1.446-mRNA-1//1//CDS//3329550707//5590//frame0